MTAHTKQPFNQYPETHAFETSNLSHSMIDRGEETHSQEHSTEEKSSSEPLTAKLAAAVSGGFAGAAIGHVVAGRVGSTIGAVVGGVAGIAVGNDVGKSAAHATGGIVEAVKEAPERVKAIATDRDSAQESEVDKVAPIRPKSIVTPKPFTETIDDASERLKEIASNKIIAPDRITLLDPPSEELSLQHHRFRYILPAKTHFHLGVALGRQGQLDAAIDEFEQVLDLAPDSAETYYNLGIALNKRGKKEQALDYLHHAGMLCVQQGKAQGARVVDRVIKQIKVGRVTAAALA